MAFSTINNDISLKLGASFCQLSKHEVPKAKITFFSIHENEKTAVEALEMLPQILDSVNFYKIKQNGERTLKFNINKTGYEIDPNRIFTKDGIEATLTKYSKDLKHLHKAKRKVHKFAENLLKKILPKDSILYFVSIHNNTDENFNIYSFRDSGEGKEIFILTEEVCDPDDFILVTEKQLFDKISALGKYHVVLQNEKFADDGSLSYYFQKRNLPYINIEAEHGHFEKQKEMIEDMYSLLTIKKK